MLDPSVSHLEEDYTWFPEVVWEDQEHVYITAPTAALPMFKTGGSYIRAKVFKVNIKSRLVEDRQDLTFIREQQHLNRSYAVVKSADWVMVVIPDHDPFRTIPPKKETVLKLIRISSDLSSKPDCVIIDTVADGEVSEIEAKLVEDVLMLSWVGANGKHGETDVPLSRFR